MQQSQALHRHPRSHSCRDVIGVYKLFSNTSDYLKEHKNCKTCGLSSEACTTALFQPALLFQPCCVTYLLYIFHAPASSVRRQYRSRRKKSQVSADQGCPLVVSPRKEQNMNAFWSTDNSWVQLRTRRPTGLFGSLQRSPAKMPGRCGGGGHTGRGLKSCLPKRWEIKLCACCCPPDTTVQSAGEGWASFMQ